MPETDFARLDPRVPVARAEVRLVTPGDTGAHLTTREDPRAYSSLINQAAPEHGWSPPESAKLPPPTSEQLRDVLDRTIASRDFATTALAAAQASADRAVAHVAACEAHFAAFSGLDDLITERTVAALRSGHGRPHGDPDDELRLRLAERDMVKADATAAKRAQAVLHAALADAQVDHAQAVTACRRAATAVLAIEATALAERHEALVAEARQLREELAAFDRIATNAGAIPPLVLTVLRSNNVNLARAIDTGAWKAKLDALLNGDRS